MTCTPTETATTEELEKEDDDAAMEEETELETAFLFTGEQQEDTEEEKAAVAANAATRNSSIAANTSPPRPSSSPLREETRCNYKRLKLVLYRLGMLAIAGVVLLGGVLARALVQPSSSASEALANCTSTET